MAVLLALVAAFGFAVASAGQQRVAAGVPSEHALKVGLLMKLVSNWRWVAFTVVDFAAFVFEAFALSVGSLVLVQAILPSALLFALPIGAALLGRRLSRNEWLGAIGIAGAIIAFLIIASPSAGRSQAPAQTWFALMAVVGVLVVGLVAVGLKTHVSAVKAGSWAAAGAIIYALTATVTKSAVDVLGQGLGPFLTSWQLYVLIGSAFLGTLLIQSAFQAGSLTASMPLMVMIEPISGSLIGSIVFVEKLNHGPVEILAMITALVVMSVGVVTLSRSPLASYMA